MMQDRLNVRPVVVLDALVETAQVRDAFVGANAHGLVRKPIDGDAERLDLLDGDEEEIEHGSSKDLGDEREIESRLPMITEAKHGSLKVPESSVFERLDGLQIRDVRSTIRESAASEAEPIRATLDLQSTIIAPRDFRLPIR